MNDVDAIINMSIVINSNNRIAEQSTDEQSKQESCIFGTYNKGR